MKRISTLFFMLFFLSTTTTFGQVGTTIDYSDALGPLTLVYNGLINGKHSYISTLGADDVLIAWRNGQWEITCCGAASTDFLLAHSLANTVGISPPNTSAGAYIIDDGPSAPITVEGSGTTSVLPVELTNFIVVKQDKSLELQWQTASELNNEKFEIEMSQNGRTFQKIGDVKGNGTTSAQTDYSFPIANPPLGISYYRLKQMDFDGQFAYSDIVSAKFEKTGVSVGKIFPNPSLSGVVDLNLSAEEAKVIQVAVFDASGKRIIDQTRSLLAGNNQLNFNFSALAKGVYMIRLRDDISSTSRRLIIN